MMMSGLSWLLKHQGLTPWVMDVETSVKNRGDAAVGGMASSPFHPDNHIVLLGEYLPYKGLMNIDRPRIVLKPDSDKLIIGHNIKFDLLYYIKEAPNKEVIIKWLMNDVCIWDTMVVEYLLDGQQTKFASLDQLSKKYGGTVKDTKIKKYWDDGVDTEDIPREELASYLEEDLKNTYKIFEAQLKRADGMNMHDLIGIEMESLKDTIIAEWYGMYINMDKLEDNAREVLDKLEVTEKELHKYHPEINWMSPKQVHTFLYGGKLKLGEVDVPTGSLYKTGAKAGLPKTKKMPKIIEMDGSITGDTPLPSESTDEEGLMKNLQHINKKGILHHVNHMHMVNIIALLLKYRALYKDFHTYYIGVGKLVWPNDSCVHATFNHTATATGRLSCHSPNLQNITSGE